MCIRDRFATALLVLDSTSTEIATNVRLDIEMAFVSGRFVEFDQPENGLPGTLIGKLVDLEPRPNEIGKLVSEQLIDWLIERRVPLTGSGWEGRIRFRVNLFDHLNTNGAQGDGSAALENRNKPFLRLNQVTLDLSDVKKE